MKICSNPLTNIIVYPKQYISSLYSWSYGSHMFDSYRIAYILVILIIYNWKIIFKVNSPSNRWYLIGNPDFVVTSSQLTSKEYGPVTEICQHPG